MANDVRTWFWLNLSFGFQYRCPVAFCRNKLSFSQVTWGPGVLSKTKKDCRLCLLHLMIPFSWEQWYFCNPCIDFGHISTSNKCIDVICQSMHANFNFLSPPFLFILSNYPLIIMAHGFRNILNAHQDAFVISQQTGKLKSSRWIASKN